MAHRPFTRAQSLQNARFLRALACTGNARLAAARLGVNRATYTRRRATSPRFATLWDAALAAAQATLHSHLDHPERSRGTSPSVAEGPTARARAKGGEPILVRLKSGRVQLRRAPRGRMTKAAEQAFLAALSATCNVRLSAAAAGFTHSAFYSRAKKDPGFAREFRLALAMGHERLEAALLEGFAPDAHEDDAWRHNDPPPIPPMTPQMAIQLLSLHRKRVDYGDLPDPMRRRRGESSEALSMRLSLLYQARLERDREAWRVAEAARNEGKAALPAEDGEGIAALPALGVVEGWSKADPAKTPHNPDIALFGGWRITDWKKRSRR